MKARVKTLVNAYAKEPGIREVTIDLDLVYDPRLIKTRYGDGKALEVKLAPEMLSYVVVGEKLPLVHEHAHKNEDAKNLLSE